jgi:hypothetical protein
MHLATERLPESLYPKIKALVMFGDPYLKNGRLFPEALRPKLLQNCAPGDPVSLLGAGTITDSLTLDRDIGL